MENILSTSSFKEGPLAHDSELNLLETASNFELHIPQYETMNELEPPSHLIRLTKQTPYIQQPYNNRILFYTLSHQVLSYNIHKCAKRYNYVITKNQL